MDQIFELSAAPHLPFSMRSAGQSMRPELVLIALNDTSLASKQIQVSESGGEIYIAFSSAV